MWGHFQPNFRLPLAAKLLIGSKKFRGCNDGTEVLVLYHCAKFGGNRTTHVGVRVQSLMFFTFYRQDLPEGSSAGIVFTHGPIFRFFARAGATHYIYQGEIWQGGADRRPASLYFST